MKTVTALSRALAVLAAAWPAADARAYTWGGKMDMTVVAEQADPATAPALPTAAQPAYYVAYDGGYIEAGDPIAGEQPPAASAMAQMLAAALAAQHYQPATPGTTPSLLLVYHWGRLSPDSMQLRTSNRLEPNLVARIGLVAPQKYSRRIGEDLLDSRQPGDFHIPILDVTERDLLQLVGDSRYFVVVSAYDYASVTRGAARLAWRLKASTRSAGVAMDEALAALLRGGAPYLGRNLEQTQLLRAPVTAEGPGGAGLPQPDVFTPPPEVGRQLSPAYLGSLIRRDHALFTGELPADGPAADAPDAGTALLPPALAARVRAYEQEKTALRAELAALIQQHTPGPDARGAIDDFDRANAARIARLTAERAAIRDELARLAAANTDAATGKSLEALQREFTADVQRLTAAGGNQ